MATICGGAYVGAITNSLSASMVLVEMTGEMSLTLHSILATTVSISIARLRSDSFFDQLIQQRALPFVPGLTTKTERLAARDVMCTSFGSASPVMTAPEIRAFLAHDPSALAVVPVANRFSANEFLGTIARSDLQRIASRHRRYRHPTPLRRRPRPQQQQQQEQH